MLLLTQVDGKFGAVVFNVGTNFIAVAYDDAGKVWEAFPRDELVKRASIALDMPSRDALFYVGMGKADVPMGTKGRPAPASYYRGCVFPFDNNMEMYYSYEPVKCPPSMADVHKTNYGTPPHPEVLACGDGVKCMPPMVVATDAGRNSLAPKVPRVGRLLGHAIIHIPGKHGKHTVAKGLCLVRFGPSLGVDTPDCFVALKSVERCTDSVELLPAAVEWGNELELVASTPPPSYPPHPTPSSHTRL